MATIDIGNYRYNTDGSVKVIDITLDYDPEEPIESTFEIDGVSYQVTNMSGCFYACSNLTVAPNIPETVTDMSGCFYGCSSLTQAPVIPSGVTDLSTCFYNCSSLTNLIKSEDTSVVQDKIYYAKNTNDEWEVVETPSDNPSTSDYYELEMSIPDTVTDMSGCFYGCYNLICAPEIPDSVISINSCFYRCYSLQTPPTIPNSVTDMAYCFASCIGLTTAPTIPESITDLTFCFYNCSALTTAPVIPNGVTNLYGCFYDCTSLATVSEIPASVTNMDYCFYNCTSLTGDMIVYNSPTSYSNIFTGVSNLELITIETSASTIWNTIVNNYDNVIIKPISDLSSSFSFNKGDYSYTRIVEYEESWHLLEEANDASVTLETTVESGTKVEINYTRAPIPGMMTPQDWYTAYFTIGTAGTNNGVTYDGDKTFTVDSNYNIKVINYVVTDISVCSLEAMAISKVKTSYSALESEIYICNVLHSLISLENCFLNCKNLAQAPSIPMGVTTLENCFFGCESLTQVPAIPSSVTNMGECFGGCRALTQAPVIPSNVTNLRSCFERCYSLTQAPVIPSSVTDIGSCFAGCTNLTQAPDIPSSVTYAQACFQNCTALTGNIKIATTAINSGSKSFLYTTQPIYLINNTSPKDVTISESLRNTAATQGNLHFEADDATSFPITPQIQRVVANESEVAGSGTYAYIRTDSDMSDVSNLPVGWSIQLDSKTLQMDGSTINPTWIDTSTNLTTTSKTWYNTNDLQKHTFNLNILSSIYDENQTLMTTRQMNPITFILAKAPPVPFSAYHNKENKTDGVAVGILATKGELFEVDWNAQFNQDIYIIGCIAGNSLFKLDIDSSAGANTDAVSGADAELFNTIKALGWYNDVIIND